MAVRFLHIHSYKTTANELYVHKGGRRRIKLIITSIKVGNPRMQPAEPAWGWTHTLQQFLKCLQADKSQQSSAGGKEKRQVGETWKCQIQNPRNPFQKQLSITTTICQDTLGIGRLGDLLLAPHHSQREELHWRQGIADSRNKRSEDEDSTR